MWVLLSVTIIVILVLILPGESGGDMPDIDVIVNIKD